MNRLTKSPRIISLQRKCAIECLEHRIAPATFMVTSFADDGTGTLRAAIEQANATAGSDDILFSKGGVIKLATALPDITDDLTITAAKKVTLDGQEASQIVAISGADVDVSISGILFTRGFAERGGALLVNTDGGTVTLSNVQFTKNRSMAAGGAIAIEDGTVTIQNAVLSGNLAANPDSDEEAQPVLGGAIVNNDTLTIANTAFSKNLAIGGIGAGGAIANGAEATLDLDRVAFVKNSALGLGGVAGINGQKGEKGVRGEPGQDGSPGGEGEAGTDAGNGGNAQGGAIFNEGTLSLKSSVLSGNIAQGGTGGKGGNGGNGGIGGAGGSAYRTPGYDGYPGEFYPAGRKGDNGYGGAAGNGGSGGSGSGGAISSNGGTVVIESSSFVSNKAQFGKAGLAGKPGAGSVRGAAGANGQDGPTAHGGAIESIESPVTISGNSVFLGNSVLGPDARGGAISIDSATLTVDDTDILKNTVKGTNGLGGAKGAAGENGFRGEPGGDGSEGGPGSDGQAGAVGGSALGGGIYTNAELTIRTSLVSGNTVIAGNGGKGGAGGNGGNGGAGGRGYFTPGYDGYPGYTTPAGRRGPGGSGGLGGDGGNAGDASGGGIFATGEASDSDVIIDTVTITKNKVVAGKAGVGGAAGKKGAGSAGEAVNGTKGLDGVLGLGEGGGVALTSLNAQITDAIIQFNRATFAGGGLKAETVVGTLATTTIDGNVAAQEPNQSGSIAAVLGSVLPTTPIPSASLRASIERPEPDFPRRILTPQSDETEIT